MGVLAWGGNALNDYLRERATETDTTTQPSPQRAPQSTPAPPSRPAPQPGATSLDYDLTITLAQANSALDAATVIPGTMNGYDEALFPRWNSALKNGWAGKGLPEGGCDARAATLIRDGIDVVYDETCTVLSGTWIDPYTGEILHDPGDIDIDHVLSAAAAFRAGMNARTQDVRTLFANSPGSLVAVSASTNRSKGDRGPDVGGADDEWKPPSRDAWCSFGLRWVQIKTDFDLDYTSQDEITNIRELIATC